ncbi:MAG: suppressor of fused domain protein [Methylophilaceae bacterium]
MELEAYKKRYKQDDAVGWECIDQQLGKVYGKAPFRHYAPPIHYRLGGEDPIDGSSVYDNENQVFHRHIVSYGMSSLYYDEESAASEFSGWGFEFTMRVAPFLGDPDGDGCKNEPYWAMAVMNNLARYVYSSKRWFEPYHYTPANGPIRLETETLLTALAFVPDPELASISTPHGQLDFLQMVGLTDAEYKWVSQDSTTGRCQQLMDLMRNDNALLITDITRKHSYV